MFLVTPKYQYFLVFCALVIPVNNVFPKEQDLIGELFLAETTYEDTLSDLARAYDQGYNEIRLANPTVDPWLPGEGTEIVIPNQFVLPNAPKEGIVVNVPEMRLYHYLDNKELKDGVVTYPVSIGRADWNTPEGQMTITAKALDPTWYPPVSYTHLTLPTKA